MIKKKHLEEGFDHKNLQEITTQYHSNNRKHRYELDKTSGRQCNGICIDDKLASKVFMDCRTTSAHKFRTRLGFKQYDLTLTKEQSVLTRIMSSSQGENMQT